MTNTVTNNDSLMAQGYTHAVTYYHLWLTCAVVRLRDDAILCTGSYDECLEHAQYIREINDNAVFAYE